MNTPEDILRQYWHYDSFRPLQAEAIHSVLQGTDTLLLLPTGGGKSLCYQLPALMMEGLCLVVSPLIALMRDQVRQARRRGIPATLIVSGMRDREIEATLNQCMHGKFKLLYVSPERLRSRLFADHIKQARLSFIAIDEAHCISQWGYDFRQSYLELGQLRDWHPQVPILALTATATPEVVDDIQRLLRFRKGSRTLRGTFVRPNLAYMVLEESDRRGRLLRIVSRVGGSGIVYVRNRRQTEAVAQWLRSQGFDATAYHAGMSLKERDAKQTAWTKSKAAIMVATNAFGMGIDKPDVRFVVHLDMPPSVEAYFQEAGRAGRDGKKAYAVLFHDALDRQKAHSNLESSFPPVALIRGIYNALCNHCRIPVGSGEGERYDIDVAEFCKAFGLQVAPFYAALRFLEREGLLAMPEEEEAVSHVFVPIDKVALYRFQLENPRYSDLLQALYRLYGGLHTEFVRISERAVAQQMLVPESVVVDQLKGLDRLKVIVYNQRSDKPQIVFLAPRVSGENFALSDSNYLRVRQRAEMRQEQMLQYAEARGRCRGQYLASVFGEEGVAPCGQCDVCLLRGRELSEDQVCGMLRQGPVAISELADRLQVADKEALSAVVRRLVEEGKVAVSAEGMIALL